MVMVMVPLQRPRGPQVPEASAAGLNRDGVPYEAALKMKAGLPGRKVQ